MLFHFLSILSLFYSVSCQISCCSSRSLPYNYTITRDNIPSELYSCSNVDRGRPLCRFGITWYLNLNQTVIDIGTYSTSNESLISAHLLDVNVYMSGGYTSNPFLKHTVDYYCSTDKCNNGKVFQRLFESLTLIDQFYDLNYLLESNEKFDGYSCLLYQNQTDKFCDAPLVTNPNDCIQCTAQYFYDQMTNKICATCYRYVLHNTFLDRRIHINITDQTREEIIWIRCFGKNCTLIITGNKIREKSTIELDFDKFLAPYPNTAQTIISSFYHIIFIISILTIKQYV
jgi:hypothetical protein